MTAAAAPRRLPECSAHPPRLLRWAMLGAALVILVAVPLMNLPGGAAGGTATNAAADRHKKAEPSTGISSTVAPGADRSSVPGLSPTSSALTDAAAMTTV